jgi:hypothetical protein
VAVLPQRDAHALPEFAGWEGLAAAGDKCLEGFAAQVCSPTFRACAQKLKNIRLEHVPLQMRQCWWPCIVSVPSWGHEARTICCS